MTQPVTSPYPTGDAGRPGTATGAGRSPDRPGASPQHALGGWVAAALVAVLLLVVSVPISSGVDRASTAIAVLLSLAGGLSVRHPVVGAVAAGAVLTLGLGNGPAHIGSGILASPVTIAACAARGHLLTAIAMAAWHVIPPAVSAVLRGDDPEFLISQVMLWLVLQTTAVLAGTWGRSLAWRARAERSRRISDLAEQRRAIARELHDTGVRAMTRVVMLSEHATVRPGIDTADAAQFSRIADTAREATEELRVLLDTLRTESSAGGPLPTAGGRSGPIRLQDLVEDLRLRLIAEGFHTQLSLDGDGSLPVPRHGVLDRCLREIEANVIRHGDRCVPVAVLGELCASEPEEDGDRPLLDLLVRNGVARDPASAPRGGAGVEGMRERLAQIGGHLDTRQEGPLFLTHLTAPCTSPEDGEAAAPPAHRDERGRGHDVTDARA